jgi:S1-C subfamily serine protease
VIGILGYDQLASSNDVAAPARAGSTTTTSRADASVAAYQQILPSLVFIRVQSSSGSTTSGVIGSGVVVSAAGQIMTAYHVVRDAVVIQVTFSEGTTSTAVIASSDPTNDIAVLKPERLPQPVVPATLGSSRALRIGDATYSVGNPLGLGGSMSAGVISGLDRTVPFPEGDLVLRGVIQFDAAVNPGSSGGPLLNGQGQVIGIVTGLANPANQDAFAGIGFAVPIATAGGAANQPLR